jgi:branched-chain amino acid transport system substrate-binding protein
MLKKILILVLVVTLLSTSLLGCSNSSDEKNDGASDSGSDVIKIGVFEPMTGGNAAGGEMTVEGIKLANEMRGEVLGKKSKIGCCG